ncbi:FtsP/CotA-like multicopper oxidase with cupredoxin domain [Nocardioides sp. BE266]|uniref:multicopper oxidase family protein n=1 Tax=Nocardioides sp. BE266 TaxID=2817725 RepID=UPI00285BF0B3|nr:multicopper oxidase family protein [Nocardioides sp. BE266]MDR7253520.1 FtsP/CotA-like multicopper oxidase with cupredoxin domain [Nocardioides sp. BE266]
MNTTTTRTRSAALLAALALTLLGLVAVPATPAAAAVTLDLYAVVGNDAVLPGGQAVHVWGYSSTNAPVARPGGPVLEVTEGEEVTLTLHNELTERTGLLFQGQQLPPDLEGVAAGGTRTYTFTADQPGTYLYEAAPIPNAQHQVAMGLYGALVVRPAGAPATAYGSPATGFDDESVLVLGEIDPALNNAPDPAAFDMRSYRPRYFLINGRAHPNTQPIATTGGHQLLLRYVNAGTQYHSMSVLGAGQTVVGLDGSGLADARRYVAETIGPGQTADALVKAPESSVAVAMSLYDGSLLLHNSNVASGGFGGMLAPVEVSANLPAGPDATGPVSRNAAVASGTLTATVSDAGRGGANIAEAQLYVDDASGTPVALAAQDGAFDSPTEAVTADVTLGSGHHVLYVRGRDASGTWGPLTSVLVDGNDTGGPTTKYPTLTPALIRTGGGGVVISATADDSASGNADIQAAEYSIDGGTAVPMTVGTAAPVSSIDATIPGATVDTLAEGARVITIRSQDAQGNWGDWISVNLSVDNTAPTTTGVTVAPTPNNGTLAYNSGQPALRVMVATMSDPVSSNLNSAITKAEAFIDTVGANGSGIPLIASDGLFNDTSEGGYADIPLTTVRQLPDGPHTISVHARDAAGNWGTVGTTTLVVDKQAPAVSGLTVTPNPTQGGLSATLSLTATDTASAIAAAEWFTGADPGAGRGTAFTNGSGASPAALSTSVDTSLLPEGTTTLQVRVRDAAGNWSAPTPRPLTVTAPLYYSTTGNANPPGVGGTADDADILRWNGTAHARAIDLSTYGIAAGANVDSFVRVDATHFYLSFTGNTTVPGLANTVPDEDIVYYNAGSWSRWFDGSAHGLGGAFDLGPMTIQGGTLYLATQNTAVPPGAGGAGDDADVYRWNASAPGNSYTRVFDASGPGSAGLPAAAELDGLAYQGLQHLYLSFSSDITVPGLGAVQDEDVIHRTGTAWSTYFNGTGHGLTSNALDIDAFDLP